MRRPEKRIPSGLRNPGGLGWQLISERAARRGFYAGYLGFGYDSEEDPAEFLAKLIVGKLVGVRALMAERK